eukprot:TRINITY_DN1942_c0_g1_i1.p1 TRINITY_DN1942_c0_g1~~TRINITY_DN1942_c0_g1_i1.p1  ORF type:complete len:390 (-),score=161.04 TRINITY_DN1942_c0_g1_i1:328-1446(-)
MPPKKKKGGGGGGKKVSKADKDKIVADKTFGMKNKKKSKKVQQYVQQVRKQVDEQTGSKAKAARDDAAARARKEQEEREKLLAGQGVVQKKPTAGEDPKSILCAFFKAGSCRRGAKCKFSHDLAVERKGAKIDIYTDQRSVGQDETMEDWDQETLESVISKKHGDQPVTDIICRFFLKAIEEKKYGWFWACPNGDQCLYRHALPPDYVFESERKKAEEVDETPIEELVEEQRANLTEHTPLTLELFLAWKEKKRLLKEAALNEKRSKKKADVSSGRGGMTGRELFADNQALFVDDESACGSSDLVIKSEIRGFEIKVTGTSISRSFADADLITAHVQRTGAKREAVRVVQGVAVDSSLFASLDGIPEIEIES